MSESGSVEAGLSITILGFLHVGLSVGLADGKLGVRPLGLGLAGSIRGFGINS